MKNICYKKTFVFGIIVLFISMSIIPSNGNMISFDDTTPPVTTYVLDPPVPDGFNGWYVSDVNVTLNATDDISGVKEIKFQVDGGAVQTILGNKGIFFVSTDSTMHTIKYWAIDYVGNTESQKTIQFKQDQTPPVIDFTYEWKGKSLPYKSIWNSNSHQYLFIFNATAWDATSLMQRVEFWINWELHETIVGPGPYYIFEMVWVPQPKTLFRAYAYDFAGLSAFDDIVDPCRSVTIVPGLYQFENLILPNNYTGYIGRNFIWATFSNP